jgi:DNA invertase Pin-like site-specific DNA recombinase
MNSTRRTEDEALRPRASGVIYARQSQDSKRSIDEQVDAGRARANAEGWTVHGDVFRDRVSASRLATKARDGWPKLLAELDRPQVTRLWLWESSRGDRTLESWAAMLTRCRQHGVLIYVETHGRLYDMANPRDWRTLAEDGIDNQYESEKVSLRVRRAMAANAAAGKPHGVTPYGYQRQYELTATGKSILKGQKPKPAEAKVIRRIFTDIARGVSLRAIAKDLNDKKVPTPSGVAWTPQRVSELGKKHLYAGLRYHKPSDTVVPATWPALVDKALFYSVRELLTDPKRRTSRPGRHKHLLSLIAVCTVCDGPLTARPPHDGSLISTYICREGSHVRIGQSDLDVHVEDLTLALLSEPGAYQHVASDDDDNALQAARGELAELQAHHQDMVDLMATRKMSPKAFTAAEPRVLADIAAAKNRVAELTTPTALLMIPGVGTSNVVEGWNTAPVVARRGAVRELFARIAVDRSPIPGHRCPVEDRVTIVPRRAGIDA